MNMRGARILVVDDDEGIRRLLKVILSAKQYDVLEASDGVEGIQMIQSELPNLVILDIMMPILDGLTVLQQTRQWSRVPVIVLSARDQMDNKVKCLDLGADDYITKPFAAEELLARVRVIFRRAAFVNSAPSVPSLTSGDLQVDFVKRLVLKARHEVKLTPTEYDLLQELAVNAGRVLTYRHLLEKVWGPEYGNEREYLHVYVSCLRAKLEGDARHPNYIKTIPGVGYRFVCEE